MSNSLKSINEVGRESLMRGIVLDRNDPNLEGRIAVFIPKIAQKFDPSEIRVRQKSETVSTENMRNAEVGEMVSSSVTTTNVIWCRPTFRNSYLVPYKNQAVYVFFEDGDPNKPYYLPYTPTLNGEVTPMEKLKASSDKFDADKKPNVHTLFEARDRTIVYFNENPDNKRFDIIFRNGHSVSLNENTKENSIELVTQKGHIVVLDQLNQHITIRTEKGHLVQLHDAQKEILGRSTGGHEIRMTDAGKKIVIKSAGGNTGVFDDNGGSITFKASTGGQMVIANGVASING